MGVYRDAAKIVELTRELEDDPDAKENFLKELEAIDAWDDEPLIEWHSLYCEFKLNGTTWCFGDINSVVGGEGVALYCWDAGEDADPLIQLLKDNDLDEYFITAYQGVITH